MGYHPKVDFLAERPFTGGLVVTCSRHYSSPDDQRHSIRRMQQEHLPIVITDGRQFEEDYALWGIKGAVSSW